MATALAPRRPTQKTSTTAKRDSSTISRTMGMARSRMARLRLPRGEILVRAAKGFADGLPDRDGPRFETDLLRFHESL